MQKLERLINRYKLVYLVYIIYLVYAQSIVGSQNQTQTYADEHLTNTVGIPQMERHQADKLLYAALAGDAPNYPANMVW